MLDTTITPLDLLLALVKVVNQEVFFKIMQFQMIIKYYENHVFLKISYYSV